MANTIDEVYIQTFETNLRFIAQQQEAKLRGFVQTVQTQSEKHNFEVLGTIEATLKAGRLVSTPVQDTPWSRRTSTAATYHAGDSTEQEDPVQMLIDPNSNLVRELGMAMNRRYDDVIIAAATAAALNGDGTTTAFTAAQTVGDGTTSISFDMITEVQELYMNNEIDPTMPKVMVVGPTQVRKLMQLTENTSADYVNREALQKLNATGITMNWMGFTWIVSTRLNIPLAGELDLLSFTPDAIGMQINRDITSRVEEDPSVSFAWRIYCMMTCGAVRVEDEKVVKIHVLDSV